MESVTRVAVNWISPARFFLGLSNWVIAPTRARLNRIPKTTSWSRWETSEEVPVSWYASVTQPSSTKAAGEKRTNTTIIVQAETRKYFALLVVLWGPPPGGSAEPSGNSTDGSVVTPYRRTEPRKG